MTRRAGVLTLWGLAAGICGFVWLVGLTGGPRALAIAGMTTGLFGLWVCVGGGVMWLCRDRLPRVGAVGFVLFATLLACAEEAVTVSMTNLAPWFGVRVGEAYITASANYLDVIAFHSVVVFVPMFGALALILRRYAFSPLAVFLGFGVVGTLCEAVFAGSPAALLAFPLWVFVYGLMVWLPAVAMGPGVRPVGVVHHLLLPPAILLLASPGIALVVWVVAVVLGHPAIDFPG